MPSVVPGFEYDIFISYRHNDNRSGWVADFVNALKEELAATLKEPMSIYFDTNPHDGLLETHHVDKSLEGKLKSLILIPVLSQTYCDTKSFAWRQEFCVFNKSALADTMGRDIRLNSGNVTSRILPVKIHDLDQDDISLLEKELGGVLRSVEFIYKEPGVNRPLILTDSRRDNQNKTDYRNQMNKLANAVKELVYAITRPGHLATPVKRAMADVSEDRPSVAVLPFSNIGGNADKEYFADGITENIISELASNKKLRIISRTSVMRYKNVAKTASEIAGELNVDYILEGGVQASGERLRINVQLVEAATDDLIWSKVFMETIDDIFAIQSAVSEVVSAELNASLSTAAEPEKESVPTVDTEAYNLFLKGRHAFNQWNVDGYVTATGYFSRALERDPEFQQAYSYLASSYSARMSWNGDLSPQEALPEIEKYLEEAWRRGPTENDYLTKAFVELFIRKDFSESEKFLLQAIEKKPNEAAALYTYSYLLNMSARLEEAQQCVLAASKIDPLTVAYFNYQSICHYLAGNYEDALKTLKEGLRLYPGVVRFYDFLARVYLTQRDWSKAIMSVEEGMKVSGLRPPSMVAFYAIAAFQQGNDAGGSKLYEELVARAKAGEKGTHIYIVYVEVARGRVEEAQKWLERARESNDVDLIWLDVDPLLKKLKKEESDGPRDYDGAEKFIISVLKEKMPELPYHNLSHIEDVVEAAGKIALEEKVDENDRSMIRLAAWLHDAGFMTSSKDHEQHGAKLARELLPQFGFQESEITSIENMILATKLPQTPVTPIERILCDADLDYLGREDFYERGNTLYEELKSQGIVESEREWNLVQKTFLESHRFHTNYSKTNREKAKQERLQEIIAKLKTRS